MRSRTPAGRRAPAASPGGGARRVRIIGGRWKRTPLTVPDAPGLRPTPDRVRETLFNWLGQDLTGLSCLDLFAGTGALGLEAASRGAREVWLVESHRLARQALEQAIGRLQAQGVRIADSDALGAIERARAQGARFDLVFLDPPFHEGWLARVLPLLPAVLRRPARVYVEAEAPLSGDALRAWMGPGCSIVRADRAGQVFYHLVHCDAENNEPRGELP
jgi:16S rRNA (guanine(966)-N(2))-methyltransferase RsmD